MRRYDAERGAVTAEFAVALPAIIAVLVLVLTLAGASGARLRALDAARVGARAVAIGQSERQVGLAIEKIAGDSSKWQLSDQAEWVKVEVWVPVAPGWLARAPLRAHGEAFAWVEPGS